MRILPFGPTACYVLRVSRLHFDLMTLCQAAASVLALFTGPLASAPMSLVWYSQAGLLLCLSETLSTLVFESCISMPANTNAS